MRQRILSIFAMLSLIVSGAMAQSLTVADITTEAGQEATITVAIEDATEMTALQFNLSLPEGFTLAGDIALGSAASGHTLSVSPLTSGDQLVVLYSLQQGTFSDGTLVTIPVIAAEDAVSGEARLYTVRTATAAAVSHTLSDVTFALDVTAVEPEPTPDPTPITAISELSNAKLYHVSQPNHSKGATAWAVAEDGKRMKSNVDLGIEVNAEDNSQLFAFVSNDGGQTHYLYHAAEKKFVSRDGALFDRPIDAIQFKAGASEATFVAYFGDGRYVNVGGNQQLAIDGWSDADGGNSCVILPAGEFDATEALAMFTYEEDNAIASLDALSNHKAYYVKQPQRGTGTSWAVQIDGAALKSNADLGITASVWDYRQHFAFLTNNEDGTYYLYHVAEAKFVAKDGSLSTQPVDVVYFDEGKYENTFVVCFDNEHYINVGGSNQMVINGWSTPDEGNSCTLIPAADFDATAALALIETLETGIEETTVNGGQTTVIYDLTGRRVEKATKGIYIVNGRKVVIK